MNFFAKNKYWIGGGVIVLVGLYMIFRKKLGGGVQAKNWSNDKDFFVNSAGKNLQTLASGVGITLKRNKGLNGAYNDATYKANKLNSKVYWAVYDISRDRLIASSPNAKENVYGASVPKVCVASAAFSKFDGVLPKDSDYQKVIQLLVKSDNNVWTYIQDLAGGGTVVNAWATKMGYGFQPARSGGNSSNAVDMCRFWNDVCRGNFKGADNIFRISASCQTSDSRSKKCLPSDVFLGGKTGSYQDTNHDTVWIQKGDKFYSISVLTKLGSSGSEIIAQMFRGLYNEYID